jgi:hypothetical protein
MRYDSIQGIAKNYGTITTDGHKTVRNGIARSIAGHLGPYYTPP